MNKMIVTVFKDEQSAYGGLSALRELHEEGSLTLYASTVIFKDANGVISVKQAADEGPFGTFAGLATGSLIGLLGGPVGLAVGAATGTLAGSLFDLARVGVSDDFLTEVYLTWFRINGRLWQKLMKPGLHHSTLAWRGSVAWSSGAAEASSSIFRSSVR